MCSLDETLGQYNSRKCAICLSIVSLHTISEIDTLVCIVSRLDCNNEVENMDSLLPSREQELGLKLNVKTYITNNK